VTRPLRPCRLPEPPNPGDRPPTTTGGRPRRPEQSPAGRSTRHEVPGRTRRPGRRGCVGGPEPARASAGARPRRGPHRGRVRALRRPVDGLRVRLRDLGPCRAGRDDRRPRPGAGLRTPAGRHHPRAAGQAGRRRGRRRPRHDLVREQPVQPADDAGRGLSRAPGDAAGGRGGPGRRAGPGRAAGRRGGRPPPQPPPPQPPTPPEKTKPPEPTPPPPPPPPPPPTTRCRCSPASAWRSTVRA
jgi:hypothetical protein